MRGIVLIGEVHTTHPNGTVLGVTEHEAAAVNNSHLVTARDAEALVDAGQARWMDGPITTAPDYPPPAPAALTPDLVEMLTPEELEWMMRQIAQQLADANREAS